MDVPASDNSPADAPRVPDGPAVIRRRRFLSRISLALSTVAAAVVGLPVLGFLLSPLTRKPPGQWRPVGPADAFKVGETVSVKFEDAAALPWSGVSARTAAWLRREDQTTFTAFAVNCTHLGCPVQWFADPKLFLCPCHGGVYNADGSVAGGPPPKPLGRYSVRVRNGQVEILTGPIPLG
jgi:quinol---cytochrome c reductase iron-sulfur subunit, bacillus type